MSNRWALALSVLGAIVLFFIGMLVLFPLYVNVGDCGTTGAQHKCEEQNLLYYLSLKFFEVITHAELWTALATLAIAAYTRTLYLATKGMKETNDKLWDASERQIAVAKESADAAKQAANGLLDAERPHMILSELKIAGLKRHPNRDGQVMLPEYVTITNSGRSPALLKSFANIVCIDKKLPPLPDYGPALPLRWVIAPNGYFGTKQAPEEILVPSATVAEIIRGETHVWGCVMVEYEDPFKRPHQMKAAYRVVFGQNDDASIHFYADGPDSYWEYT